MRPLSRRVICRAIRAFTRKRERNDGSPRYAALRHPRDDAHMVSRTSMSTWRPVDNSGIMAHISPADRLSGSKGCPCGIAAALPDCMELEREDGRERGLVIFHSKARVFSHQSVSPRERLIRRPRVRARIGNATQRGSPPACIATCRFVDMSDRRFMASAQRHPDQLPLDPQAFVGG